MTSQCRDCGREVDTTREAMSHVGGHTFCEQCAPAAVERVRDGGPARPPRRTTGRRAPGRR